MKPIRLCVLVLGIIVLCLSNARSSKADVVWIVDATFDDKTKLTGTFTINSYGYLENNYSLTTTNKGAFTGFTYTSSNSYFSNGTFFVDYQPGYSNDLHLAFLADLSVPKLNNPIVGGGLSYECQDSFSCYVPKGGAIRYIEAGFASAVPEPSTWAMVILGFAGVGYLRSRRRNERPALAAS